MDSTKEIAKEVVDLLVSHNCSYITAEDIWIRVKEVFREQPIQPSSTVAL